MHFSLVHTTISTFRRFELLLPSFQSASAVISECVCHLFRVLLPSVQSSSAVISECFCRHFRVPLPSFQSASAVISECASAVISVCFCRHFRVCFCRHFRVSAHRGGHGSVRVSDAKHVRPISLHRRSPPLRRLQVVSGRGGRG